MNTVKRFCGSALLSLFVLVFIAGCGSDDDTTKPPAPPGDTTAPVVSLDLSRTIVLDADSTVIATVIATDDVGVTGVEIFTDDIMVWHGEGAGPWAFELSFTSDDNGINTFLAKAYDAAENVGESSAHNVAVGIDLQIDFVNGDLEDGSNGWMLHNNDVYDHGYSADGGNPGGCLRLNEAGSCELNPGAEQIVTEFVPGLVFEINGEYKPYVDWIGSASAESFVVTVDSVVVASFARGINGSDWSPFSVSFMATAETHTIGFWAEWSCDDSSYEVDNLVLFLGEY